MARQGIRTAEDADHARGRVSDSTSIEAIRSAVRALESRGISNASDVVRAGAAAMVQRAVEAFDARSDVGPGWLAEVVRSGGPWAEAPARQAPGVETVAEILARWEQKDDVQCLSGQAPLG